SRTINSQRIKKRNRTVGLRIEIEEKSFCATSGKSGSEVNSGGSFADTAFLISDSNYHSVDLLCQKSPFTQELHRQIAGVANYVWPLFLSGLAFRSTFIFVVNPIARRLHHFNVHKDLTIYYQTE